MKRLLLPGNAEGFYHVVSRVVDRRKVLGDEEKRHFVRLMKGYAVYCGVRVVGWCLMENHFHLLVEVSAFDQGSLTSAELVRRLGAVKTPRQVAEVVAQLEACGPGDVDRRPVLDQFACRMGDLSWFMKPLLQRFTRWFNRRHDRQGYLWSSRFRSVVVEAGDGMHAARVVAAYIDLNPVRAALVADPADYRWSGYGVAVAGGDREASAGIRRLWGGKTASALQAHRVFVFGEGGEERVPDAGPTCGRSGIPAERVREELRRGGRLPLARVLRMRVRYLTDGGAVGGRAFVERMAGQAGVDRKRGGTPMRFADWGGLHALRALRVRVVG